jgi:Arc/MetJ-type ribon-helix-helix transcriptional regulator
MATVRAHVVLPAKLAEEIDELVGSRGRSAFLVEVASAEVKRRQLKAFLQRKEPAWTDENHPDIAAHGAAAWVRSQRDEKSDRQKRLDEKQEMKGA